MDKKTGVRICPCCGQPKAVVNLAKQFFVKVEGD